VTKRQENARHRAAQNTGSLEVLSKAVASNAGTVGRQAAVIAAAGGLVVTLGVSGSAVAQQPAQAAKADNNTTSLDIQRVSATQVVSAKVSTKDLAASVSLVKVVAAPAVEPVAATTATLESTTPAAVASTRSAAVATAKISSTEDATASAAPAAAGESSSAADETPATSANVSGIAATALSYKGAPYVLGGNTPSGWDCSGFVRWVYKQHGLNISARTARGIWTGGQFKKTNSPKPGDIIIQRNGGHIAIYIGNGMYIGAQNPSAGTTTRVLAQSYDTFNGYYTWVG